MGWFTRTRGLLNSFIRFVAPVFVAVLISSVDQNYRLATFFLTTIRISRRVWTKFGVRNSIGYNSHKEVILTYKKEEFKKCLVVDLGAVHCSLKSVRINPLLIS